MVTCTYLGLRLARNWLDGSLFMSSLIGAFGYIAVGEDPFWRPALALAVVTTISLAPFVRRVISTE